MMSFHSELIGYVENVIIRFICTLTGHYIRYTWTM